jgi:hypothetical protein
MANNSSTDIMDDILSHYRPQVIALYNKVNFFRSNDIPVEEAFWNALDLAHSNIQNGKSFNPMVMRGTAGLHAELSTSPAYNPYQVGYNEIISRDLHGWENRVNLLNAYSGTSYYMFRIDGNFYLVWLNSHGEINQVCSDWWLDEIPGAITSLPVA